MILSTAMTSVAPSPVKVRPIPGSYGPPVLGPLRDRLDYFWFQGPETFFRSRISAHDSTVFRTNMPPTFPFFVGVDPRVVCVLDCVSFSALFDSSLVDKRNVLIGSYMPSLSFTGGTRVGVYQDTTEPSHARVKSFCFAVLRRASAVWATSFLSHLGTMLAAVEAEVASKGSSNFFAPMQKCVFSFLSESIVGADPSTDPAIGDDGFIMLDKWLALQLLPTVKAGVIPQPLEELLLHSFPYPSFLVAGDYKKLYNFVEKQGRDVIDLAISDFGLNEDEAIHNILFVLGFNAFGGFSVFFPSLISTLGKDKTGLGDRLKEEVRGVTAVKALDMAAVREMELVQSTVYEVLRMNPPVPLQYGRARRDFELASHTARFGVRKGELLCGYQPLVMRDPKVFDEPETFVAERFMGEKGKELLDYLYWSNGPETGTPTTENKQCAAKDYVVATACLMVAELYDKYDSFECNEAGAITKMEKRKDEGVAAA